MTFGQFAATTQFYLYGRRWCTRNGWLKSSSSYPQPDELESLDISDRVYIVTGANSGIGYECSSYLAKKNATVYMVCRNQERAEQAKRKIMDECECKDEKVFILLGDCSLQSGIDKVWKDFVEHRESSGDVYKNV
jgi:dehydrogenase/reductase SDR family protein 12